MFKLIKLELHKNNLKPYFIATLFIALFMLGFIYLTAFIPVIEADSISAVVEIDIFSKYISIFTLISVVAMALFSILSTTMYSKFIIDDYLTKKSYLLFCYPIKRRSIFCAKYILVSVFNILFCILSLLIVYGIFILTEFIFHIVPDTLNISDLFGIIKNIIIIAFISNSVGIVSMRVGFWRKSSIVAVVTSFIISTVFCNIVSNIFLSNKIADNSFLVITMVCLIIISILILFTLSNRINKMEVL